MDLRLPALQIIHILYIFVNAKYTLHNQNNFGSSRCGDVGQ